MFIIFLSILNEWLIKANSYFVADLPHRNSEYISKLSGPTRFLHFYFTQCDNEMVQWFLYFINKGKVTYKYSQKKSNLSVNLLVTMRSRWYWLDFGSGLGINKSMIQQWRNKEIWSPVLRGEHSQITLAFTDKLMEVSEKTWHNIYATTSAKV